jgi:hypothetical protein
MFSLLSLLCIAVAAGSAAGQIRFDVAPSAGLFSYRDYGAKVGASAGLELLARYHDVGLAVTEEVGGGAAHLATYADVTYSHSSGPWSILLGAGPSHVSHKNFDSAKPLNVEAELGHTWRQTILFLRYRYRHYVVNGFRDRLTMSGPSFSFGARIPIGPRR